VLTREEFNARVEALTARFPYQFEGLPGYMLSIEPGWLPLIEQLCADIDALLAPAEKPRFRWSQIKEKFARLCAYWEGGPLALDFLSPAGALGMQHWPEALPVPREVAAAIEARIRKASEISGTLCQACGAPGAQQRGPTGWVYTLCHEHAHFEGPWPRRFLDEEDEPWG
jgi:hypothetical protein